VAPRPALGKGTSLQVAPKLDRRLARRFRALAGIITVSPPLVTSTTMFVPAANWPVTSALDGFTGPRAGPRYRCIDFEISPSLSSAVAPRRRGIGASGSSTSLYAGINAQGG
jgi:hypothetical protein